MTARKAIWSSIGFLAVIIALNLIGRLSLFEPVVYSQTAPSGDWAFYITDGDREAGMQKLHIYFKRKRLYLRAGKIRLKERVWVSFADFTTVWTNDTATIQLTADELIRTYQAEWNRGRHFDKMDGNDDESE